MKKYILLPALVTLFAIPTFAASLPNYVVFKPGAYLPQASDVEEFDNSFYGEIGFGHYFLPNIALEFGVGYTKSSASESVPGMGSADVDLTIVPITLGLKLLMTAGNFEPFVMAGVGAYYVKGDASASLTGLGSFSGSENDTTYGGFLGLGSNFDITLNTFVGFEGKYFISTPSFNDVDVDIDGINVTANIGYRF